MVERQPGSHEFPARVTKGMVLNKSQELGVVGVHGVPQGRGRLRKIYSDLLLIEGLGGRSAAAPETHAKKVRP